VTAGKPTLSVVVPVHNNAPFLAEQLAAIAGGIPRDLGTEILVVDNRSTDGSGEIARTWSKRSGRAIRVVAADERPGEPHARNVGFRAAAGPHIAFCDGDDVVSSTWVAAMARGLTKCEYVTGPLETARLNQPWLLTMRDRGQLDRIPKTYGGVPFAHGCNMGFRRQILERLGGFDESFLTACDVEIAVRAWRAGIAPGWEAAALVHYRLRPTLGASYRQARAYGTSRSRIRRLLPDVVDTKVERVAMARRIAWLVRHLPDARHRAGRARWVWVAGQVEGEVRALLGRR